MSESGTGTFSARFDLPLAPISPRLARLIVTAVLTAWGHTQQVEDAVLIGTELVTNAILYGPPGSAVHLDMAADDDGHLWITVSDGEPEGPHGADPDPDDEGGRGLMIVEALTCAWGYESCGGGKRVWASLD